MGSITITRSFFINKTSKQQYIQDLFMRRQCSSNPPAAVGRDLYVKLPSLKPEATAT